MFFTDQYQKAFGAAIGARVSNRSKAGRKSASWIILTAKKDSAFILSRYLDDLSAAFWALDSDFWVILFRVSAFRIIAARNKPAL